MQCKTLMSTSLIIRNNPFLDRAVSQSLVPYVYGLGETVQQKESILAWRRGKAAAGRLKY